MPSDMRLAYALCLHHSENQPSFDPKDVPMFQSHSWANHSRDTFLHDEGVNRTTVHGGET